MKEKAIGCELKCDNVIGGKVTLLFAAEFFPKKCEKVGVEYI
jgi:hypothetical protein